MDDHVIQVTIDRSAHTVLVVDDNPATRYSTSRFLRAAGFKTAEAGTGGEALDLAVQDVSAMVLDVHLPDIDGFEVCRIVKSRPQSASLPVVHLSAAYVRNEDRVTGLNAGADAYLVHPVEPPVLVATLQALIRARAAEDDLRRSVEREQAARAIAERHSRTKDDFIAILSHELRTPLNAIMGWVHVLMRRDASGEMRRGLEAIERNARAQALIISDILDVSRINSGKLRVERSLADPAELVLSALTSLSGALGEKALQVRSDVEAAHEPAWLDPIRFQQIFGNLMSNAIKFSRKGGEIHVSLARAGRELTLAVRDFGQGIKPEFLPHLFDRFTQGDAPGVRQHGGLGLGLSIVKHLVELHGGSIEAHSEGEGSGTTMTARLNVGAIGDDEPLADLADHFDPEMLRGLRVLVVEDDADAREMLQVVLGDRHVEVSTASDYPSALARLQEEWPEVLVCDIGLPGRDGYELMQEVRRLQPRGTCLKAIALTAFTRPEDREKALQAGFDAHLPKPLSPHELLSLLAAR